MSRRQGLGVQLRFLAYRRSGIPLTWLPTVGKYYAGVIILANDQNRDPFDITDERREELLDGVVGVIKRYGLITPAIFFGEMNKPLSFIASQAMHFFTPVLGAFLNEQSITEYATLLEDRSNLEMLLQKLEKAGIEENGRQA